MFPLSSLLRHRHLHRLHLNTLLLQHHKCLSTTTPTTPSPKSALQLPLTNPIYSIWASNTSLGKTLVSTGLASSFLLSPSTSDAARKFLYLKPFQTGFPEDSDSGFLFRKISALSGRYDPHFPLSVYNGVFRSSLAAGKAVLARELEPCELETCEFGMYDLGLREQVIRKSEGIKSELVCQTMYAWKEAVSPHLAAEREGGAVKDSLMVELLERCLTVGFDVEGRSRELDALCVVETSGGVASPGPSGSLQCDLYRPLRLPAILVGDGRLGGISGTISAYESLKLRGYDVIAVIFEDHGLVNEVPLIRYLRNRVPVLLMPSVPQDKSNDLMEWFDDSRDVFTSLKEIMLSSHSERIQRLRDMPSKAGEIFWWPFTQHKLVPEETITVIDSRCGENFSVYKDQEYEVITQQFDACASWWTQGPDANMQTELAGDMGYAAARFGHVMFPENVYEPALECAELLLEGVGKGWASRTYFSDNGSTAIEIALKMAFRKYCFDHKILPDFVHNIDENFIELKVLALRGSYHGDTLGAMEAQAPSSYTGFLQQPWYTGRGVYLDPPTVSMCNTIWNISLPEGFHSKTLKPDDTIFRSRDRVFDRSRDQTDLAGLYTTYVEQQLLHFSQLRNNAHIGALIIEPVIQGAGGMHMIDPLFQRILVNDCRNRNIPVIFDEVFTGFWRLGVETASELLCCLPDIACFGKLMTGGIIPLSATLATEAVFDSFVGDSKVKALLHGHSYSAHAMGCTAAAKSIKWFKDSRANPNITSGGSLLRELWDAKLVHQISSHPAVQRVVALGTLCAVELKAEGCNAGYGSLYANSFIQKLREDGVYMRPLGNVIYLMCGPCTSPDNCGQVLLKLYRRLEQFNKSG